MRLRGWGARGWAQVAFCCEVFQGYGMTENAAAAVVTPVGYRDGAGKVGEPIPSCEVKLEDVPEMNYLHTGECSQLQKEPSEKAAWPAL